jgi:hypothetical protein
MEKQYGPRAAGDQKPPILPVSIGETSSPSGTSFHPFRNETTSNSSSVSSGSDGSKSQSPRAPLEGEEVIAHQKYEIMRLLNTVKTLSTENTKLLKKCEGLATIHDENSQITESMESFKKEYNQKVRI